MTVTTNAKSKGMTHVYTSYFHKYLIGGRMVNQHIDVFHPLLAYLRGFMKRLMDLPILLCRLGCGSLIGKYIMILTTTGRTFGKLKSDPIDEQIDELLKSITIMRLRSLETERA